MTDSARPSEPFDVASGDTTDDELLMQIRSGHAPALGALLDRYWTPLVTYAGRLLGSWDAANDVAQETFIRLWEHREDWRSEGSVRALLFRITRNLALDHRKRHARRDAWVWSRRDTPSSSVVTPVERVQESELESAFEQALAALPVRRREVFLLARTQGLSHRQISEVMGIAPQTVANQLSAALASLRDSLEPFLDTPGHAASSAQPPGPG